VNSDPVVYGGTVVQIYIDIQRYIYVVVQMNIDVHSSSDVYTFICTFIFLVGGISSRSGCSCSGTVAAKYY